MNGHLRAPTATAVARDLHDIMGNDVSLALRYLELYEIRGDRADLAGARSALTGVLTQIRQLAAGLRLRPAIGCLATALRETADVLAPAGTAVEVELTGDEGALPERHRDELFLVLREGLRNVFAHSGARTAHVAVRVEPDHVRAVLTDDGIGLDHAAARPQSTGLACMRERIMLLGGSMTVRGDAGTRTEIVLPLRVCDAA